jgi:hypothetical protein
MRGRGDQSRQPTGSHLTQALSRKRGEGLRLAIPPFRNLLRSDPLRQALGRLTPP